LVADSYQFCLLALHRLFCRQIRRHDAAVMDNDSAAYGVPEHQPSGKFVRCQSRQSVFASELESQKFDEQTTLLYEPQLRAAKIQAFRGPLFNALTALASALVLYYGGRLVLEGKLNVGQLTEFYLYLGFLIPPIRMIGPQINMTSRAIASGKRIFEVLDTESAVKEKTGRPRFSPMSKVISNSTM